VLAAGIVAGVLVALGAGYGVMRYFSAPPAPGSIDAAARVAAPDLGARLASAGTKTPDATAVGQEPAEVAGSGGSSSTGKGPCQPGEWGGPPAPPLPLRKLKTRRSQKLIVGFSLDDVVQGPALVGQGVRGRQNALGWALRGCSDSPDRRFARQGTAYTDQRTGLRFEITGVKPAGRTGRSWPGVSCSYRISDPQDPRLYVDLDAKLLPAFNELTVALRDGPMVYVALQFNGYAREVGGQGNRVLGLDLCEHRLVWSSPDMVSNSPVLLRGPHLITAYGFTAEPDFLYVLDRRSGKVVNRARLPKGADELRLVGDRLYVRIYDGYIVFGLGGA
jgi:hypothetical protein